MKRNYFAYIRVSTARQGQHGSSLQEQRDLIEAFALHNNIAIGQWFEDRETAAKSGRTQFVRMMTALEKGKAAGVILHKIDRGARNLWDWARIQRLLDAGLDVRVVHDNFDMNSRGGRLAADIQAVVAADYVRNLRDEVRKGLRGRLKQGLYPLKAPVGYLDHGGGKPKTIDPVKGPLVRLAFELYASRGYSYRSLRLKLRDSGLCRRDGSPIYLKSLTCILRNPFYTGLIRVKGETYEGVHEPLISADLFKRVQDILDGRDPLLGPRRDFLYRRLIRCKHCNTTLVGERHKLYVYYRCHTPGCKTKSIREEMISAQVLNQLEALRFSDQEIQELKPYIAELEASAEKDVDVRLKAARLQISALEDRERRLTDAYIDQAIDRAAYEERRAGLHLEIALARESLQRIEREGSHFALMAQHFFAVLDVVTCRNLIGDLLVYRSALSHVTLKWVADGKNVYVTMKSPFQELISRLSVYSGEPGRDTPRNSRVGLHAGAGVRFSSRDYRRIAMLLKRHLKEWEVPAEVQDFLMQQALSKAPPQWKKNLRHQNDDEELRKAA